jgi:hypothetical protein
MRQYAAALDLLIDTVVCLPLAKWETVSGQFGGYLTQIAAGCAVACGYVTTGT